MKRNSTAKAVLFKIIEKKTLQECGFDAFIAKPIIAKEFFKEIQEVLYGK